MDREHVVATLREYAGNEADVTAVDRFGSVPEDAARAQSDAEVGARYRQAAVRTFRDQRREAGRQPVGVDLRPVGAAARCLTINATGRSSMTNREIVEEYSYAAWVKGDLSVIDGLFADNFVTHDHHASGSDRESYKQYIATHLEAIERRETKMHDVIADGDRVATRWTVAGFLGKDLMGLEASGQRVVLSGIAIYRLADGLIAEKWSELSLVEA